MSEQTEPARNARDIAVVAFDAYGTLFDVASAARRLAETLEDAGDPASARFAQGWAAIAEDWRRKQLEYSWLRAVDGRHVDFETVTENALEWALEANDCLNPALTERLMGLYRTLDPYPEARGALEALAADGRRLAILSNGAPRMLDAAVRSAQFDRLFDAVMSVESVGVFKPSPKVYRLASESFDCQARQVCFVSSNGWDACSAAAFGFRTVWVNRRGDPVDRLGADPEAVVDTLATLPDLVARFDQTDP